MIRRPVINRRNFLIAAAAATRLRAQSKPIIPVKELNHMTLSCSDPKRSLEFYQGLFGMPVHSLNIWRVLGCALMVAGIALISRF